MKTGLFPSSSDQVDQILANCPKGLLPLPAYAVGVRQYRIPRYGDCVRDANWEGGGTNDIRPRVDVVVSKIYTSATNRAAQIMTDKSARVFLTKLGAAERQLSAAIRMVLANEDELAIHTVAAAAYRVLRDIKQQRGRSDAFDLFERGLSPVAHDLATGKINSVARVFAYEDSPLVAIIDSIRDGIIAGDIKSFEDVPPIKVKNEGRFWYEFNEPFNFLKHA